MYVWDCVGERAPLLTVFHDDFAWFLAQLA